MLRAEKELTAVFSPPLHKEPSACSLTIRYRNKTPLTAEQEFNKHFHSKINFSDVAGGLFYQHVNYKRDCIYITFHQGTH